MRLAIGLCTLLSFATGCTETSVSVSKSTPLRQFLALSRAATPPIYRLVPGDQVTARFYFNPQLDEDLQVRPDGNNAQYFVKPTAVVIVRQFTGYRVFTAGELRAPGQFSLVTGARTVLESLAASGGVTDNGTLTHVILIRRLATQQQAMVAELDLADALSGSDPGQDVPLMPNDFVYVPRSGAADLNLAMQQYLFRNLNLATGASFGASYNINNP
jgi:protein involved in polysaccharide export with SLBB domain